MNVDSDNHESDPGKNQSVADNAADDFATSDELTADTVPHKTQSPSANTDSQASELHGVETESLDTVPIDMASPPSPDTAPMNQIAVDGATRQLAAESYIAAGNARLLFGQATDVGMARAINQDSSLSFYATSASSENRPDFGIFIVADGMGGHQDGEKASAITTRVVAHEVTNTVYTSMLSEELGLAPPPITEVLTEAIQKANAEVVQEMKTEGGTTCTAVALLGDRAFVAHVGDSRAYLITNDNFERLTRDHSFVQRLIEVGQLTEEEAEDHPRANELYRALGFSEELEIDTFTRRLPRQSRLLLCSDGLWNYVGDDELAGMARDNADPQVACDKLVTLANTRGGSDNITVILLQMP